jgi:hypothetical protein
MHFGGVYVFSEGFASDRRKASRGSTNQNVTGLIYLEFSIFSFCAQCGAAVLSVGTR